jgi:hypothetical protein
VEAGQAGEVEIPTVPDVEGASLDQQLIGEVHVVHAPRREEADTGDVAAQVQEGVELHCALALEEGRPRKQREAQIDRRRVEGVHRRGHLDAKIVRWRTGSGRWR